jgi:hypothetical protein
VFDQAQAFAAFEFEGDVIDGEEFAGAENARIRGRKSEVGGRRSGKRKTSIEIKNYELEIKN